MHLHNHVKLLLYLLSVGLLSSTTAVILILILNKINLSRDNGSSCGGLKLAESEIVIDSFLGFCVLKLI